MHDDKESIQIKKLIPQNRKLKVILNSKGSKNHIANLIVIQLAENYRNPSIICKMSILNHLDTLILKESVSVLQTYPFNAYLIPSAQTTSVITSLTIFKYS